MWMFFILQIFTLGGPPPERALEYEKSSEQQIGGRIKVDTCGASTFMKYRGSLSALRRQAQVRPTEVRVLTVGDAATSELLPRRLNIITNQDGAIIRVYCG
jgi:hypothetical protein